jgi:serine protease AprX
MCRCCMNMDRIRLLLCFLILISGAAQAQVNRYMVFFKDKVGTPYSISTPETFLSSRALQRRSKQNISVTEQDLPVTPSYITAVRNSGANVLYRTKWMNGILVECDASLIPTLQNLPSVNSVVYVAPGVRPAPGGRVKSSSKFKESDDEAGATDVQLSMLGMDDMHIAGYRGEGKLVAILDAGFPGVNTALPFQHIFAESRFDAATSYDFVSGSSNVFAKSNHGTHVLSIVGAHIPGSFAGGAYKANFILFVTEYAPSEYRVEEYNWLFAVERADSAGVDVINTSLGYSTFDDPQMSYTKAQMDGQTAVITRAANMAVSKGIAVVVSAGNEGNLSWGIIAAPADSKTVLTVGSVNGSKVKVPSSSTGPTADGRIKPDVVALGSGVSIITTTGEISSGGGTSYAAPLITSLVTGVWQMLPNLSVQELFDTIRNRSSQFSTPDNFLGYGIPSFANIVTSIKSETDLAFATVYPNPVFDKLKITLTENMQLNHLMISVFDSKGGSCNVNTSTVHGQDLVLDFSDQKPGLYLIRLQNGNQLSLHKILKIE